MSGIALILIINLACFKYITRHFCMRIMAHALAGTAFIHRLYCAYITSRSNRNVNRIHDIRECTAHAGRAVLLEQAVRVNDEPYKH
jgi:hypothetical protein